MKQSTYVSTHDRKEIFTVTVTEIIDRSRIATERILPNGETVRESYYFSDARECVPGKTVLDVKPSLNGRSNISYEILGETPAEFAASF